MVIEAEATTLPPQLSSEAIHMSSDANRSSSGTSFRGRPYDRSACSGTNGEANASHLLWNQPGGGQNRSLMARSDSVEDHTRILCGFPRTWAIAAHSRT